MTEILHTTLAFIVAIALLIAVHEYGHFSVARRLGIKVEKFSIGFGPALFSWRSQDGEVLYVIAAIPLGGYVKMLGENPEEQEDNVQSTLSEADRKRAFNLQPVWKRAAVAAAGPAFNFVFAVFAYMVVAWLGQAVLPTVIGHVAPASVAEMSGLQIGDRIVAVQGREVHSWQQMEELLKQRVGGQAELTLNRDDKAIDLTLGLPQQEKGPLLMDVAGQVLGFTPGLLVSVEDVVESSPANQAGLLKGDVIQQINGRTVSNVNQFIDQVKDHADRVVKIVVKREQTLLELDVIPVVDQNQQGRIGVKLSSRAANGTELYRMGVWDGVQYGFVRTWEMTTLTLGVFAKMVTSAISPDNLGGPIAIAQLAGKTAEMGLVYFLSFLALISVNLGVLNLLPIPVLDGGLLVYLGLEKLRGKALSPRFLEITQFMGLALIVTLMVYAFYNDLSRLFRG
ncbi:MAG: RIP metalloprotease RseP [Zetaproteobacteria bacterium CG1_02_53_45]|nr:MAG: RIP metalloprotease RseP [Zetaproteobacteria bacterium CG1_02_53_45]